MQIEEIDISKISPSPHQPREKFEKDTIKELGDSIHDYGLLQPIVVRPEGDENYQIIAGERRWRASQFAELKKIPAIIKDISEERRDIESLMENIQRQDLSLLEKGNAAYQIFLDNGINMKPKKLVREINSIRHKLEKNSWELSSQEKHTLSICQDKIGKKLKSIEDWLKNASVSPDIQKKEIEKSDEYKVSGKALARLSTIDDEDLQKEAYEKIDSDEMGSGEASKFVTAVKKAKGELRDEVIKSPDKFSTEKVEKIMELDNDRAKEEMIIEVDAENLTEDEVVTRVERLIGHKEETGEYPGEVKIEEPSKRHVEKVKKWSNPSFLMTGGWEDELSLQDRDIVVKELKETKELINHALRNLGDEPKEVEVVDVEAKDA